MLRFAAAAAALMLSAAQAATPEAASPQAAPASPPAPPTDACAGAAHHAFDFWVGEWDAYVTGSDRLAGRSSIRAEDMGCVITEHWVSQRAAYSGRSLNMFDSATGKWLQFWMDSTGDLTRFEGGPSAENQMVLVAQNDLSPGETAPKWRRMTFTKNPDGTVRQHGEGSTDHGRTWTTEYDFTYRPHAG